MNEEGNTQRRPNRNQDPGIQGSFSKLMKDLKDLLASLVDLRTGMDVEGTIVYIKNSNKIKGSNAWMLMCSIVIASLGLDLSSPAIIIGAMLISPLMSPILGIGLGVGINDRGVLVISLKSFVIAIFIALISSFLYFLLNPLGQSVPTPEILSRTSPTILDAMVGAFGGLAGIISMSRKEQSNALPGVAIATALMPPLCVAGYGLAQEQYGIFLNAFYLFFLNSFFIALSTFVMIRYLGFPQKRFVDRRDAFRTRILIFVLSLIITVPSGMILYNLYQENLEDNKLQKYINDYFGPDDDPRCIDYKVVPGDSSKTLLMYILGKPLSDDSIQSLEKIFPEYGLEPMNIYVMQDAAVEAQMMKKLEQQVAGFNDNISNKFDLLNEAKASAETTSRNLQAKLDSLKTDSIAISAISLESRIFLDALEEISFARMQTTMAGKTVYMPTFLVKWSTAYYPKTIQKNEDKLEQWLKIKTKLDTFRIVRSQ